MRQVKGNMQLMPYPGGKYYMKGAIIRMIPEHKVYVEPFAGALSVLLHKEPSPGEVVNDIDDDIYNLWVQVQKNPERLVEEAERLWYSRKVYLQVLSEWKSGYKGENDVERAARILFLYNAGGKMDTFFRTVHYKKRGGGRTEFRNGAVNYRRKIELISVVSERLRNVVIECEDFRNLMTRLDSEDTFFFCDPPYFESSYQHKFKMRDHEELAEILGEVKGKFLLTYKYDDRLLELYPRSKFNWLEFEISNHFHKISGRGVESRRKEVVITNYDVGAAGAKVEVKGWEDGEEEISLFGA